MKSKPMTLQMERIIDHKGILKKIIIMVLLLSITCVVVCPQTGYGSNSREAGGQSGDYMEYYVKSGDTLNSIAQEFGIDMWDIIKLNNIKNKDKIYVGQKLLLDTSDKGQKTDKEKVQENSSEYHDSRDYSDYYKDISKLSMDFRNADLRDVLSTLAISMGCDIVLAAEPQRVTMKLTNVSAEDALEIILHNCGLSYTKKGDILVVGSRETLETDFFDQMAITRFKLKYISAENLKNLIAELNIPIQNTNIESNPKMIWVQGTPEALQKVRELIAMVDVAESGNDATLFHFRLKNITAKDAVERFDAFAFENTVVIPFNYIEFGKDLMVICPPALKTSVLRALEGLDWRGLGAEPEDIYVPVDSAVGSSGKNELKYKMDLLKELIDELNYLKGTQKIRIYPDEYEEGKLLSEGMEPESINYYLLVKHSPDVVQKVRDMIDYIDDPKKGSR